MPFQMNAAPRVAPASLVSLAFLVYNPLHRGGKGASRMNEQTINLNQALLAAIGEAKSSEGTIYFPTGEYCIHPVQLPSHITLMGNSAWAYANKDRKDEDFAGRTTITALSGDARALFDLGGERGRLPYQQF